MTINKIISAFVKQLKKYFDCKVYKTEIPQMLKKPSFYVELAKLEFKRMVGLNRLYELYVSVTFFSSETVNKNMEYNEILQTISENFDYLQTEDRVLHLNLITQDKNDRDDALVFLFKLNIHARKEIERAENMEKIEVYTNVEND